MLKNKRGLSAIVVALILVLLSIVAVGVVWVVIGNLVEEQSGEIASGTRCLDSQVTATKVTNPQDTDYSVTLERTRGRDEIGGVEIIIENATGEINYIHTETGNIQLGGKKTVSISNSGIVNANNVDVRIYFGESGQEEPCQNPTTYEFEL